MTINAPELPVTAPSQSLLSDDPRASAAERALREALERGRRQQAAIAHVAVSACVTTGDTVELGRMLTELASTTAGVERVGMWLFDADEHLLHCEDLYEATPRQHSSGLTLRRVEFQDEFAALLSGKYVDADDPLTDPRTRGYVEGYLVPLHITSMLDAVIRTAGRNLGVLCFEHVDRPHHWAQDEISFACQLADQIAIALLNRERRLAEAERETLQEQLLQSQKMESVGRLAGGVAHDFNNMLGVILIHTEMALNLVDASHPIHAELIEIEKAAARSADLTRQLLAFARRQTIVPKVLKLNDAVDGMLKMMRRLIGEHITLNWIPGANLMRVKVDDTQIGQVLANLCVNARDAIGGIGDVTIETRNARFDEAASARVAECAPGDYVMLAVSDSGEGMSAETLEHVFEPFFTTKGPGKGTGLGLSTVYGIVRQNGGFVTVDSSPGAGSTFRIYLPSHVGPATAAGESAAPAHHPVARGRETVLLVEDEPGILGVSVRILERLGYTVLAAPTPGDAIRMAAEHQGHIHLLITDVVMPEMNGRELAKRVLSLYPEVKRLFMSGYTADVMATHGVMEDGLHFIQKPFGSKDLASKVRGVLDSD